MEFPPLDRDMVRGPDGPDVLAFRVQFRGKQLARSRERFAESLLRDKLPRSLHWLIDHPGLLRHVLRVVKRWSPKMTMIDLKQVEPRRQPGGVRTLYLPDQPSPSASRSRRGGAERESATAPRIREWR